MLASEVPMPHENADERPSATIEDYLQSMYSLETEGERIISARLARWMRVTPPTAWATVQRMHKGGMVEIDDKKTIHLTPHGRELAGSVARRHRLSERFLNDVLGLGWAEAHEEAHHFEHGMTPVIEASIVKLLGNPTTCPHGSPIPGTGATLDPSWRPMDTFEVGERMTVRFISEELEEDLELLRYLDKHGLKPGQPVVVNDRVPSAGLLVLQVNGEDVSLGLPVASRMRAEPMS
jgi:DtxR family transcriptional regulator, Mn-dependent transcriptional regulator